jgi:plasmid maintenance system antidote protein VapI
MLRNIKAEMIRMGFSTETLAIELDVANRTVQNWISEATPIPSHKLIRLSKVLRVSTDELLGLTGMDSQEE